MRITDVAEIVSGTPQFRIVESMSSDAPSYLYYGQADLNCDLEGAIGLTFDRKQIKTFDAVITVSSGDVVFSLLSGTAAIVGSEREGYLLTQNYVKFKCSKNVEERYLVYLLNTSRCIRRQLRTGQQGSATMKLTIRQLSSLELPQMPPLETQRLVASLYLNQLRLATIKKRVADSESVLLLETLRKVGFE